MSESVDKQRAKCFESRDMSEMGSDQFYDIIWNVFILLSFECVVL